jgi:hypothetical protein
VLVAYVFFLQSRILHLRELLEQKPACEHEDRTNGAIGARPDSLTDAARRQVAPKSSDVEGISPFVEDDDLHIVFSTGCNAFQHWQAEALLNSALHAGQKCKITRIVVGCDKQVATGSFRTHQGGDADRLIKTEDLSKSTYPNYAVHVAPAVPEAKEFPWFNKPWSFHHWLLHTKPTGKVKSTLRNDISLVIVLIF